MHLLISHCNGKLNGKLNGTIVLRKCNNTSKFGLEQPKCGCIVLTVGVKQCFTITLPLLCHLIAIVNNNNNNNNDK